MRSKGSNACPTMLLHPVGAGGGGISSGEWRTNCGNVGWCKIRIAPCQPVFSAIPVVRFTKQDISLHTLMVSELCSPIRTHWHPRTEYNVRLVLSKRPLTPNFLDSGKRLCRGKICRYY